MGATARHARLIECATIFACWGLCSCSPHAIRRRPHMPLIQDEDIAQLLRETKTIAIMGISTIPRRRSYAVLAFFQKQGHGVLRANPTIAGELLNGELFWASLDQLAFPLVLVNIFR